MGAKILTGIGCFFLAISLIVVAVSIALPPLTHGRTSWEEAMLGIVPGAICSVLSFLALAGGVIWLVAARRKPSGPAMDEGPGRPR